MQDPLAAARERLALTAARSLRPPQSRLVLLVQGVCRVVVVQPRRETPYSRADVMLAPDEETLRASGRRVREWLRVTRTLPATDESLRTRLALAAAAAEDGYWRAIELCDAAMSLPTPRLCQLSMAHRDGSESAAGERAIAAMQRIGGRLAIDGTDVADVSEQMEEKEEEAEEVAAVEGVVVPTGGAAAERAQTIGESTIARWLHPVRVDDGYHNASAWHTVWLRTLLDVTEDTAVEAEAQLGRQAQDSGSGVSCDGADAASRQAVSVDTAAAAEEDRTLRELELQVWLELDCLVNPDSAAGGAAARRRVFLTDGDVPPELLVLLPPPPAAGWPDEFGLDTLARGAQARASLEGLLGRTDSEGGWQARVAAAAGAEWPLMRRVARLSYAIWAVIGNEEGAPLQRVLETTSVAERLRYAILRMRVLTGRTLGPG
jgi:hypothetical protein